MARKNVKHLFIITTKFMDDDSYPSSLGYKRFTDARDFLIKERNCTMYQDALFKHIDNEYGYFGKPNDRSDYTYAIHDIEYEDI